MDALQFLSSIVSSLAWPAVVAYLLFLVRAQLGSLAQRLTELSLPGGTKAVFQTQLALAQRDAQIIVSGSNQSVSVSQNSPFAKVFTRWHNPPEDAPAVRVIQAYYDLNNIITEQIDTLPVMKRSSKSAYLRELVEIKALSPEARGLYDSLGQAEHIVYMSDGKSVTTDEAIEFERLCIVLKQQLQAAFIAARQRGPSGEVASVEAAGGQA